MNRWYGSNADSEKQSSERDRRAARRYIASNIASSEDEEFKECDTSLTFNPQLNLDGDTSAAMTAAEAAALAAQRALPVEDADFPDDSEAWKKEIKIKFDQCDVNYSFNSIEDQMTLYGINSQWSKKKALLPLLPEEIIDECKPILRLSKADAGAHIYKDLKAEILQLYGPREEDAFKKAMALRLTGKPSALGKKLI